MTGTAFERAVEAPKSADDHFRDWEANAFGFGYGTGEPYTTAALRLFFGLLDDGRNYDYRRLEAEMTPTVAWLMINRLCRLDVIEYGASPRHGWLTEKGRRLAEYIIPKSVDQLLEVLSYDHDYTVCYPDACNCGPGGYEKGRVCQNPFWLKVVAP